MPSPAATPSPRQVLPLRALRYTARAGEAASLLAPPYDVVSASGREALLAANPHNVIAIEIPERRPEDRGDEDRADHAAERLRAWVRDGILALDPTPAFYLHEHRFPLPGGGRGLRRALLARVRHDPGGQVVRPHEHTLEAPRGERLWLLRRTRTQISPVLAVMPRLALPAPAGPPVLDARMGEEQHQLWRIDRPEAVAELAAGLTDPIYIADGHHRYAAAQLYREEARAARPDRAGADGPSVWTGEEPECFSLFSVCAAEDSVLLPWHRLVEPGFAPPEVLGALAPDLAAEPAGDDLARLLAGLGEAATRGEVAFGLVLPEGPLRLLRVGDPARLRQRMPAGRHPSWRALDVAALETVLHERLALAPGQVSKGALRYTHDAGEARAAVRDGRAALAFLLNPTPVAQILAVADAGESMPPKSTYFHPKAPTGLALYPYDDPPAPSHA